MHHRDNLVQQLGQELGVTIVAGPNNSLDVYTTGGAALVDGGSSANLIASSGSYGGGSLSIIYQPTGQDITGSLSGGTIGGIVISEAQVVAAQNSVGALATALSSAVNTQQSLGLDLNGALGSNLFSVGGPTVLANASNTGGGTLSTTITDTDQNNVPTWAIGGSYPSLPCAPRNTPAVRFPISPEPISMAFPTFSTTL